MRVIVLSPALPLPFGRADARWLHVLLSQLARRSIDVTCISCTEDSDDQVAASQISAEKYGFEFRHVALQVGGSVAVRKARSLARPRSEFMRSAPLSSALGDETNRGYDVLHTEHLFSSWATRRMPRNVVYLHHLEVVDWEQRTDLSLRERIDLTQMRRATASLLKTLPRVIVASSRLQREVARFRHGGSPPVVPVALDPDLYPLLPAHPGPVLGMIGSMHWYPSRSAAERVLTQLWPKIHLRCPEARLIVSGWNADRYLGEHFPLAGAELLGPVEGPEDFFAQVSMLLYPPPRGSGMKIKVLESMAYGVPVISNEEGFEGIDPRHPARQLTAESDDDFVDATVSLVNDPLLARRLRTAGRELIEKELSPGPAVDRLLDAYAQLGVIR